jgi:hypothetical protein
MSSCKKHPHFLQFLPGVQSLRPPLVPKIVSIARRLKGKMFAGQLGQVLIVLDLPNHGGCRNV